MRKLWYRKPARHWREALPVGNGFTGVMIYGGKKTEKLCFNDGTLWSGYPKDYNSPGSLKALSKVRALIFAGRNSEADALAQKEMSGFYSETFLPLGSVKIRFQNLSSEGYQRVLDLEKGVHTVATNGASREAFASNPDRVSAYHIVSQTPFSMTVKMNSKLRHRVCCNGGMYLMGNAPDYVAPNYLRTQLFPVKYGEKKGMAFCLGMQVRANGTVREQRHTISIRNATEATLYFITATGFQGFDKMPETDTKVVQRSCRALLQAVPREYQGLLKRHTDDFSAQFNRQSISLSAESALATDELLRSVKEGGDLRPLCELFYHYGKYMTISASRAGGQPMNLQGIWNDALRPPWSSNYTVNINTQMNYWGASACGLGGCVEPLLQMVWETLQNGRKTARINYGCCGFACNHNVDLWRKTTPVRGTPNYMLEPLCGVWLANEVYAHARNGALAAQHEKTLAIVEEAARFACDYLVPHKGYYVVCPAPSPENTFSSGGKHCALDYASAFDMALVRQAFQNALEITADAALIQDINERLPKLYPFKKGPSGICEWHQPYETPEQGHRHFSPLYAFYPAKLIGFHRDLEQTEWARALFEHRLKHSGQHIGWSAAWAICLAARLRDAKTAEAVTRDFLCNAVFRNLFCVHPPYYFQIDGNLGYLAGLNEMLVTEEDGVIELLPALPADWKDGSVSNIVVNGAQLSFCWAEGKVTEVSSDKPVKIRDLHLSAHVLKHAFVETEEHAE